MIFKAGDPAMLILHSHDTIYHPVILLFRDPSTRRSFYPVILVLIIPPTQ